MNFLGQHIDKLLKRFLGEEIDQKVKNYFISGSYKSVLMQGSIALLTFLTALFIARTTGDTGFGIYTTVFTWVSILSIVATLGLDDLVLKQIPAYTHQNKSNKIKGLLVWTNIVGIVVSALVVILFWLLIQYVPSLGLVRYSSYFKWALVVVPCFVLMHTNQASLRGFKMMGKGQFAEKFVQPLSFFLVLIGMYFTMHYVLTDIDAVIARTISFIAAAFVALILLYKNLPASTRAQSISFDSSKWFSSCRYFAIMSILYIINTRIDIVLLDYFKTGEAPIAYYNAAVKLSDLALIPFAVLYTVTAPMYASLYAQKKTAELQAFFTRTSRLAFVLIACILVLLVLSGEWLLALFGDNFKMGYGVLIYLCLAKLIHVFFGPVNYLLMMIDLEKEAAFALLFSVMLTVACHFVLIPMYQIEGAAIASLIGLVGFELVLSWIAYRKAGIMPTIFGRFSQQNK